ncbi:MAG: LysR family transcriptional regulator [Beijerinckiaceae bacterium]|nr:LysR family transcriptional regulator [Beijerinckiaceae bacterium]MCI0734685.1 LysR family transcriptional regulator [Beijerinckiaceae bacterium]
MELHQIRHFIAVAETGGFTKGAQRVAVSQPAISASIAKLEAELDVKLLERRHTQVVPTPAGLRLLEVGRTILQKCNAVKAEVKTIANHKRLRIGILQLLFSGHVSKLLRAFRGTNRDVTIEVVDGAWDQLFGFLDEQELDAAVTILNGKESKFASQVLFTMPYVLAVREDHRFALWPAVTLADLDNEPFILPDRCPCLQEVTDAIARRGTRPRIVYQTDRDDRALALVAAGLGVALVPSRFEVPAVKQIPVLDLGVSRTVGLVWLREREDACLKEFIAFAESHCRAQ